MKKILRRISGKITVEEVDTIEQTRGPLILEIKTPLTLATVKCELKEFEIEVGLLPNMMTEIPPLDVISEIDFNWYLQGKFRMGRVKIFSTKFLKRRKIKKAK